ncbi:hypothetical protein ANTPLA_LOCUS7162 [Anthophora plagiata]
MKSVAIDLGVGTSTVSDWKKNRKETEDFCAKMVSRDSLGPILRKKALSLNEKVDGDPTFTASVGWLGSSDRLLLEDDIVTVCLSTQDEDDIQSVFNDRCHQELADISYLEATEILGKLITYFEQQSDTLDNDVVTLRHLHNHVTKKYLLNLKKEKSGDFIK